MIPHQNISRCDPTPKCISPSLENTITLSMRRRSRPPTGPGAGVVSSGCAVSKAGAVSRRPTATRRGARARTRYNHEVSCYSGLLTSPD